MRSITAKKFLGNLCRRKHDCGNGKSLRFRSKVGNCVECLKLTKRRGYLKNRDRILEQVKARTKITGRDKKRWRNNKERESARYRRWRLANMEHCRKICRDRHRLRRKATPPWANKDKIKRLYLKAKTKTKITGKPHQVDHIIPLKNKFVCGLHVESNLRVVRAGTNIRKKNTFLVSQSLPR